MSKTLKRHEKYAPVALIETQLPRGRPRVQARPRATPRGGTPARKLLPPSPTPFMILGLREGSE